MSVDLVPIPDEILDEDEQTTPRLETVIDRYVQAGIAGVRVAVAGQAEETPAEVGGTAGPPAPGKRPPPRITYKAKTVSHRLT